jgi:hypothetical protein
MLYPGQFVYIEKEEKLGMYVGYEPATTSWGEPDLYVYRFGGEHGVDSNLFIYEPNELTPVVVADNNSITKQKLFVSRFQKEGFDDKFTEDEMTEKAPEILNDMIALLKKKWFKTKYKITI